MRYFYPVKVSITEEKLNQSKAELEVYQSIINSTFSCMQERVEENHRKHELVHELNNYVGESIQDILSDEKEFYDSDTHDKLKVPPFTKVKRIPRDYTKEEEQLPSPASGRKPYLDQSKPTLKGQLLKFKVKDDST